MLAGLPTITGSGDDMVQVWYDAGGCKRVAVVVEVHPPRIARTVREYLELVSLRMIPPDARVQRRTLGVWSTRFTDSRVRENAMASVEPAVRPPAERVERFVGILVSPAVE